MALTETMIAKRKCNRVRCSCTLLGDKIICNLQYGTEINAWKVAEDYSIEKEIRRASARKELRCKDKDCQHPVLRYCNGEKKAPYFAHLDASDCDYSKFERNFGVMEELTTRLAKILEKNGYQVDVQVKLFKGHISYLVAGKIGESPVAIDFITHKKGVEDIDGWAKSYQEHNIPYTFIVADENLNLRNEQNTFFAKRYSLNETANNYLVTISWDGKVVTQTAMDRNYYNYKGRSCSFPNEMGMYYFEHNGADVLGLEDCQITIPGFSNRFESWLLDKECFFNNWKTEIDKLEEEERIRREEEAHRYEEWKKEQERIAEKKRLEEQKWLAEEEEARLRRDRERKEESECNTEEKRAELARKRALEHPRLFAVYEILSGCKSVNGEFQFKVSDGFKFRRGYLDIQSVSIDYSRSRIVLLLTNKTQAFLFISENGEEDKVDRSGNLFMNIDMTDVPLKKVKEELDSYISFR